MTCPYCLNDGIPRLICGTAFETEDGFVFLCSRPQGHVGDHVACGEENHEIAKGKNEEGSSEKVVG